MENRGKLNVIPIQEKGKVVALAIVGRAITIINAKIRRKEQIIKIDYL